MKRIELKKRAEKLRKEGKTYSEINRILNSSVPKSTLSCWCKNICLTKNQKERINKSILINIEKSRKVALVANKIKRERYLKSIFFRNKHLSQILQNKDIAKTTLAILYLGEGSKTQKGSLGFGNSDPFIIDMFLNLMRKCYNIDEKKFRCTIQCRADQNIKELQIFWSNVTKIPISQFYRARVDPRTIGKKSKKIEYKGVCRIDYFSAEIFIELMQIPRIIHKYKMGS